MAIKTIIEKVDNCIGCPPELGGCRGESCANHPRTEVRRVLVCDACGMECSELVRAPYQKESAWICEDCLQERLQWMTEVGANRGVL